MAPATALAIVEVRHNRLVQRLPLASLWAVSSYHRAQILIAHNAWPVQE